MIIRSMITIIKISLSEIWRITISVQCVCNDFKITSAIRSVLPPARWSGPRSRCYFCPISAALTSSAKPSTSSPTSSLPWHCSTRGTGESYSAQTKEHGQVMLKATPRWSGFSSQDSIISGFCWEVEELNRVKFIFVTLQPILDLKIFQIWWCSLLLITL